MQDKLCAAKTDEGIVTRIKEKSRAANTQCATYWLIHPTGSMLDFIITVVDYTPGIITINKV